MRRAWAAAVAAGLVLLLASPARAKGPSHLEFDEQVERNEVLSTEEVFWARTKSGVREYMAGGPYFVYLSRDVPGVRLRQAPPLPEGATILAPIEIGGYEKQGRWWSATFGVDFRMPDVPLGSYRIDICTHPCTRTIEELEPTPIRVVSGPLEERLEESIDASIAASEDGVYGFMHEVDRRLERRLQKDLNGLREYTRVRIDRQSERFDKLSTALQSARRAAADKPFPIDVAGIAFAFGALLAGAGWFFGPRLAPRASPGEKKVPALKDAA